MSEQVSKRRTSPFIVWPACLFFVAVLYVASFGPVWGLYAHDRMSPRTYLRLWETVYFPQYWIDDNTDFFTDNAIGRAYMKYVLWFGP